jgi:hypothetical protein
MVDDASEPTNTESSPDDYQDPADGPDTPHMTEAQAANTIYMAYRKAKRHWRRFTGKPVRKFRRKLSR